MQYTVINAGIIGNTLRELRQRFPDAVSLLNAGDTVVILSGINDMLYPGHITGIAEYEKQLQDLIGSFQADGIRVVIGTVPQIDAGKYFTAYPDTPVSDPGAVLANADCVLREVSARNLCRIWDLRKILGNETVYRLNDGMHLSPAGAEAAAATLADTVRKVMKTGGTVLCFGDSIFFGPWLKGRGKADPDGETIPSVLARILNS